MQIDKKMSKKAEKGPKIEPKTDTSKIYELGYILLPTLDQTKINAEIDALGGLFTKRGGEFIDGEVPVLIDLAYPMVKVIHAHRQKCTQGYFGWMKFEIETEALSDIKKALDNTETILRYLLVKTVRESTLLKGKMDLNHGGEKTKRPLDEEVIEQVKLEVPTEINEEELDKSIDDLVIV